MDPQTLSTLNLRVLSRYDPHITHIIDVASYVVLYDFSLETQSWTKKGVEGTLFIYHRNEPPHHAFIVLNRNTTQNFGGVLASPDDLQVTPEYIIHRADAEEVPEGEEAEDTITGIWIFEPGHRARIAEQMSKLSRLGTTGPERGKTIDVGSLFASVGGAGTTAGSTNAGIVPPVELHPTARDEPGADRVTATLRGAAR